MGDFACQKSCGTLVEAWRWWDGEVEGLGVARQGDRTSIPYGISANGHVIVGSSGSGAFLWDRAHGMRDLEPLLVALGAELQGFELRGAWGVSDDGRGIMGPVRDLSTPNADDYTYLAILPPACADRIDNDGDDRVDSSDRGCRSRMDARE